MALAGLPAREGSEIVTEPTTASTWSVWTRPNRRHKWRCIGSAPTESEAWKLVTSREARGGDVTVTAPGRDPNRERTR